LENKPNKHIGIIGFGQIGASLTEQIQTTPDLKMQISFIYESDENIRAAIPEMLAISSMEKWQAYKPDLVIEAAHPDAVRQFAATVLKRTDLMVMSVSALADSGLEAAIRKTCLEHGTRLYIPHGATLGLDGLKDGLSIWEQVSITMKKNPRNLNFDAAPDVKAEDITGETVLYDGPTRGVLPLYPKNVNSHATLALSTLGLDRTRSVLIADPSLEESVIEIDAFGQGNRIHIERRNPIKGVSGKLTILSVMESVKNILCDGGAIQTC